ncbi:MAG: glycosyltransferase family 4 protein [Methanomassiliicoccus sp.]|nr:glycosyltransferase family 4 protein [Methanomassiliicoccus sp.]
MRAGLIIYGSLNTPTGGYLYDRMLVRHLEDNGDEVEVMALHLRRWGLPDNVDPRLLRRLLALDADVLLEDELAHPSLCLLNRRLRRSSPTPMVAVVHHLAYRAERSPPRSAAHRQLERLFLYSVDGFIFNSDATRASVRSLAPWAEGVVARPGKDHVTPCHRVPDRGGAPLRVLYLGNVLPHKGLDDLVRAVALLPRGAVRLEAVGAPLDLQFLIEVQELVVSAGMEGLVHFHGRLDDRRRDEMLRGCDVLAVPSYHEGYGLVIVEAMAQGLPVIAPASGGAGEIVTHGEEGYLLQGGDVDGMADRLRALYEDATLRRDMSQRSRRRFDTLPTWEEGMSRAREYLIRVVEGAR